MAAARSPPRSWKATNAGAEEGLAGGLALLGGDVADEEAGCRSREDRIAELGVGGELSIRELLQVPEPGELGAGDARIANGALGRNHL